MSKGVLSDGFLERWNNMLDAERKYFLEVAKILLEFSQSPVRFQSNGFTGDNNHVTNHARQVTINVNTSGTAAANTNGNEGFSSPNSPKENTGRTRLPDSRPIFGEASYPSPVSSHKSGHSMAQNSGALQNKKSSDSQDRQSRQASNEVNGEESDEHEDEESDENVSSQNEGWESIRDDVPGKKPQPTYGSKQPSAAFLVYAVLARAPGGLMTLYDIRQTIKERFPQIQLQEQTIRAALSRKTSAGEHVFEHDKEGIWRILGFNEEKINFGSGGCKPKNDNSGKPTRKRRKADESSQPPRKTQKSAAPTGVMLDAVLLERMSSY
jgi:hypothetical protein